MAQIKQNRQEWETFIKKTGFIDPVIQEEEEARKRKAEEKILIAVGTVQDRQNQESWRERQKEIEVEKKELEEKKRLRAEKKKNIISIPGKILKGVLTGAKKGSAASSGGRRPVKGRKAPVEKRSKPVRFEDREFEMPDFNPGWER